LKAAKLKHLKEDLPGMPLTKTSLENGKLTVVSCTKHLTLTVTTMAELTLALVETQLPRHKICALLISDLMFVVSNAKFHALSIRLTTLSQ
jgi:hypothetical protein